MELTGQVRKPWRSRSLRPRLRNRAHRRRGGRDRLGHRLGLGRRRLGHRLRCRGLRLGDGLGRPPEDPSAIRYPTPTPVWCSRPKALELPLGASGRVAVVEGLRRFAAAFDDLDPLLDAVCRRKRRFRCLSQAEKLSPTAGLGAIRVSSTTASRSSSVSAASGDRQRPSRSSRPSASIRPSTSSPTSSGTATARSGRTRRRRTINGA